MNVPILHLLKWNDEFIKYLNTFPKEIEYSENCRDLETGRPAVKVKFRDCNYLTYYVMYWCDCCKYGIAWRRGFDERQLKRCMPCRRNAEIISNRKSSKTYRDKNKIKTNLEIPCQQCNQLFIPIRSTKKFCSVNCRVTSYRKSNSSLM